MASNIAIVYRSKSGFTKKYAEWISEAVHGDLLKAQEANIEILSKYDTIVYGGGLYALGINGLKLITRNYDRLKGKKLIVFSVGASPVRTEAAEDIKRHNFTQEQLKAIHFYMLRGGFNYQKCTPVDKILMNLLKIKLKKTKQPDADQRGMLASYDHPLDFTDRKYIAPIVEQVNEVKS